VPPNKSDERLTGSGFSGLNTENAFTYEWMDSIKWATTLPTVLPVRGSLKQSPVTKHGIDEPLGASN
jgi:hypothetical protein